MTQDSLFQMSLAVENFEGADQRRQPQDAVNTSIQGIRDAEYRTQTGDICNRLCNLRGMSTAVSAGAAVN
jgi:hypothetical protein